MTFKKIKIDLLIIFLLFSIIGIFLRSYNINWGSPFFFHPDERNIASSISQLMFPKQMNPNFFAYGSFPIYLSFLTGIIQNRFLSFHVDFTQAILITRFYSSLLSILLIPSIYFLCKKFFNQKVGLLTAILSTFSTGLIQFAHFGTFEIWITFLSLWLTFFTISFFKSNKLYNLLLSSIIFGLLVGIKISNLTLFLLPLIGIILVILKKKTFTKKILYFSFYFFTFIILSILIYVITNPFVFLDTNAFLGSMHYESSVALGTLPVFYTGEFFEKLPIIFQFKDIYPFILNPLLTLIFIPSFFYCLCIGIKNKNYPILILNSCFLILFLSQAFFFTKWTRYMIPTLPFIYIMVSIFLEKIKLSKLFLTLIIGTSIIFSFSYFTTAFVNNDTREEAVNFAEKNINPNSAILSEVYDLGIIPFNPKFNNITLFNFYDLEDNNFLTQQLTQALQTTNYIILPSQRILKTRINNKKDFQLGNKFYTDLLNGNLDFEKIYQTPCNFLCKITYIGDPIFSFEETASVFDRPTVLIFKKIKNISL